MVPRVIATRSAENLIDRLIVKYGPVMFHLSGGGCDGSAPMCYLRAAILTAPSDILLGEIGGSPFYISRAQHEYWKLTQLIIDVVVGRGGMFSLEGAEGLTFLTRSRPFTDEELALLANEG